MSKQPRGRNGTSRDKQAAERKEQLLAAAKSLFAEKGYHATSTRMISQKIGMADGLLYHYFPDGKMEMLQSIIKEGHEKRVLQVDESRILMHDDPDVPLKTCLVDFLTAVYRILLSDKELLRIQFREQELLDESVVGYLSESVGQRRALLAKLLERRAALGQIREIDYDLAAIQVMSVNMMIVFKTVSGIDLTDGDADTFRERMIAHLVDGWTNGGAAPG
ncbi:TetR/AcrR family transcriptional regulator [Paenibacillus mesophilus]|uniref:TetR/AcrR family transcriptional regulator n=1 Tax=Paenibacillus mesophilus TaxID=2582849 RepID=UPI00110DB180|nr:TetR/AcrR family transcriptional regulator [Paenibacillus mesophilus]TMV52871.1 TetR/AcrR family transcriptional regulator [Paenibacillus mesophilus]